MAIVLTAVLVPSVLIVLCALGDARAASADDAATEAFASELLRATKLRPHPAAASLETADPPPRRVFADLAPTPGDRSGPLPLPA